MGANFFAYQDKVVLFEENAKFVKMSEIGDG